MHTRTRVFPPRVRTRATLFTDPNPSQSANGPVPPCAAFPQSPKPRQLGEEKDQAEVEREGRLQE
eukprot:850316-Alexandrium_andersonii.AAC.1